MIHIIEKGTKQKTQCSECGCIFSFEKEDIEIMGDYTLEDPISFEGAYFPRKTYKNMTKFIKCPQCSNVIVLEAVR